MKTWKRNAIIATVLVLVCAGIYLNWMYGKNGIPDLTQTLDADKIMDDAKLVLASEDEKEGPLQAISAQDKTNDYFAQVRRSRQSARDEAVNLLQETIAYAEGEDTSVTNQKLESIVNMALTEAQIESMVIAKGYTDCVAYITDEGVSVAVASPEKGLQEQDVAIITDVVQSQGDFDMENIRVIGVD